MNKKLVTDYLRRLADRVGDVMCEIEDELSEIDNGVFVHLMSELSDAFISVEAARDVALGWLELDEEDNEV